MVTFKYFADGEKPVSLKNPNDSAFMKDFCQTYGIVTSQSELNPGNRIFLNRTGRHIFTVKCVIRLTPLPFHQVFSFYVPNGQTEERIAEILENCKDWWLDILW